MWQILAWLMIAVGALIAGSAVGKLISQPKPSPAAAHATRSNADATRSSEWLLVFVGVSGMSSGVFYVTHTTWSRVVASVVAGVAILVWLASGIQKRRQRS